MNNSRPFPGSQAELHSIIARARQQDATLYERLGVPPSATKREIRNAYRDASRLIHPDKCDVDKAPQASAKINEAHQTLTDDEERRRYDAELRDLRNAQAVAQPEPTVDMTPAPPAEEDAPSTDEDDDEAMLTEEQVEQAQALGISLEEYRAALGAEAELAEERERQAEAERKERESWQTVQRRHASKSYEETPPPPSVAAPTIEESPDDSGEPSSSDDSESDSSDEEWPESDADIESGESSDESDDDDDEEEEDDEEDDKEDDDESEDEEQPPKKKPRDAPADEHQDVDACVEIKIYGAFVLHAIDASTRRTG